MITEEQRKKIEENITYERIDSSGGDCKFININGKWGVKCFFYDYIRDTSYVCQQYAATLGMAPKVAYKFIITGQIHGDTYYCHLTEVAKPLAPWGIKNKYCNGGCFDGEPSYYEYEEELDREYVAEFYEERMEWIQKFKRLTGYEYTDFHTGNFGFLNDKLVCIDFTKSTQLKHMIKDNKLCTH